MCLPFFFYKYVYMQYICIFIFNNMQLYWKIVAYHTLDRYDVKMLKTIYLTQRITKINIPKKKHIHWNRKKTFHTKIVDIWFLV